MLPHDTYILFAGGLMLISLLITWRINRAFEPGKKKGWLRFSTALGTLGLFFHSVLTIPWEENSLFPPSGSVFLFDDLGLLTLLTFAFLALQTLASSYTQHCKKPDDLERMKAFLKEAKDVLIIIAVLCILLVVLELLPFPPPVR